MISFLWVYEVEINSEDSGPAAAVREDVTEEGNTRVNTVHGGYVTECETDVTLAKRQRDSAGESSPKKKKKMTAAHTKNSCAYSWMGEVGSDTSNLPYH